MMKEGIKGMIVGLLVGTTIAGGTVWAATGMKTIDVIYDNIKIYMDGDLVEPKDANGQTVEPFIYNGTTYLPVRAVGNAIGKEVSWDGVEKVVYLGAKPGNIENWLDVCGPYQYSKGEEYRLIDNKYFTMSGQKYTNGFVLYGTRNMNQAPIEALFNLNGKYNSLSFKVGHIDGSENHNWTMNIYLDGVIAYTKKLQYDDVAQDVTIPLNGALQMKIALEGRSTCDSKAQYGFTEGKFE